MTTIDFTPQWYHARLQTARDRRRRLGYLGAVFVMMAGWFCLNMTQIHQAQAGLVMVQQEHGKAARRQAQTDALAARKEHIAAQLQRFEQVARQLDKSLIFSEISYWIPGDVQLTSFKIEKIASSKPHVIETQAAFKYRRSDVVVSFKARAQKEDLLFDFVVNLQRSPLFEYVDFDSVLLDPELGFVRDITLYVYRAEYIRP